MALLTTPPPASLRAMPGEPRPVPPAARTGLGRGWGWGSGLGRLAPGLGLCAVLAWVASASLASGVGAGLARHGLGALTLALLLGVAAGHLLPSGWRAAAEAGTALARQQGLRTGVMLFGLGLSLQDLAQVGVPGVLVALAMLGSTVALAAWVGPRGLGLDRPTALLIGAGSAICGAAAVVATAPVVRARADQTAVAVSTVVLFGTLSVLVYPPLMAHLVPLGTAGQGWYLGATLHEVAQVVAAGRAMGDAVARVAVVEKMVRVMALAPFLLGLAASQRRGAAGAAGARASRGHTPWFAWGFLAMVLLHSSGGLPAPWEARAAQVGGVLLAMAMAALGFHTRWAGVRAAGWRPLALGAVLWLWLVVAGAGLVVLAGGLGV